MIENLLYASFALFALVSACRALHLIGQYPDDALDDDEIEPKDVYDALDSLAAQQCRQHRELLDLVRELKVTGESQLKQRGIS